MAITEALRLLITADTAGAVRGIQQVGRTADRELSRSEKNLDKWGNRLTTVGAGLVGFGSIAAFGLGQAAKSASNLGEAVNASNVVFGDAVGIVDGYAKDSAKSMGLSEAAFRTATTQMGAQLQNLGFDQGTAAESSVRLTQRAADMASVFNTDVTQATEAIGAALRGERDPIERFGVSINEAAVKSKAMELGLAGATGELDLNAKALATEALILEQTDKIAGDFANTSDDMANKQRVVSAEFENLKASIGEGALPVMETMLDLAQGGIGIFQGLDDATGGLVGKVAAFGTIASLGIGGLSLVAGFAIKARDNFKELGRAAQAARTRIAGMSGILGPAGVAGASLAAAVGIAEFLKASNEREILKSAEAFAELDDITREVASATLDLNNAVKVSTIDFTASNSAAQEFAETGTLTEQAVKDMDDQFGSLLDKAPELAQSFIDNAEAIGAPRGQLNEWRRELADKIGLDAEAVVAQDEYTESVEEAAGATEEAISSLQGYADALAAQFDPLLGYTGAVDKNADALAGEAEAQAELDALRADGTATAEEIRDAEEKLEGAHRDVQSSAVDLAGREAELIDKFKSGELTAEDMKEELDRLEDQGYLSADAAADLRAKIDAIKSKSVHVDLSLFGIERVFGQLRRIPSSISIPVNLRTGRQTLTGALGGITFHEGGVVPGPRGQEVAAILQAGEEVTSLAEIDARRTIPVGQFGGGAGVTYVDQRTIQYHIAGQDPQGTVEAIKRYERMNGPGWRS